jgi:hypothetical protein
MATRSETTAGRRNAVRLIKDPSNLAGTAPTYGGTELGALRGYRLMPVEPVARVRAEEKGGRPVEGIRGGRYAILVALLRGFDADAISLMFPDATAQGDIAVVDPGTVGYPGALATATACKILAVPEVSGEHAIYFPRAMPILAEEVAIPFENRNEVAIAVSFEALPDATGRIYYVAPIARITL